MNSFELAKQMKRLFTESSYSNPPLPESLSSLPSFSSFELDSSGFDNMSFLLLFELDCCRFNSVSPLPLLASGNDGSNGKEMKDATFHRAVREIMNQAGRRVGTAAMEDRRSRSLFGALFEIVHMVWDMLGEGSLHPEKNKPKHLLWTLYFLKVYPREGLGCTAIGMSRGAVDPSTMYKWVWLFLERITKLADEVVSSLLYCCLARHCL